MPKGLTAVLNQPGKPLELETLPTPEVEPGGILVRNTAAAICGSDLHYWRNDGNYTGPDLRRVPGHEFTGVVHSLGAASHRLAAAAAEGRRPDGLSLLQSLQPLLLVRPRRAPRLSAPAAPSQQFNLDQYPYCDGGYADYYYLPPGHYVFTVPDALPDEAIPPVNCALCQVLHGIEHADMKFGDVVAIQGAGGLGIYAAAVAAEKGASKVISIDGQRHRLAIARQCGATDVIDINEFPTPEARVQRVRDLTDGRGADVVVEVVGIAAATSKGSTWSASTGPTSTSATSSPSR